MSLLLTMSSPVGSKSGSDELNKLMLQVAQELRYNDKWLTSVTQAMLAKSDSLPTGRLKTDAITKLVEGEYEWIVRHAYGEEKYIYEEVLVFRDLAEHLERATSIPSINRILRQSDFTLSDIHFLNNFLYWYISQDVKDSLSINQLYSLGWQGLPGNSFQTKGATVPNMKYFVIDSKPIFKFEDYLGIID